VKNTTSFAETNDNLEMTTTLSIPKKNGNPYVGSDFDLDKARQQGLGLMLDVIGAFSPRLISSLQRRMSSCRRLLISHLEDIEYNDGRHIMYRRKDGTVGNFNVDSFKNMQDIIKAFEHSCFKEFCSKKGWVDQVLKALLNDTEQDHSDCNGFKYSQLVSILCELQACPIEYMPK